MKEDIRKILSLTSVSETLKLQMIDAIVEETKTVEMRNQLLEPVFTKKLKRKYTRKKGRNPITAETVRTIKEHIALYGRNSKTYRKLEKKLKRSRQIMYNLVSKVMKGKYDHLLSGEKTTQKSAKVRVYKHITQDDVDVVHREYFVKKNTIPRIALLLGRGEKSVFHIIRRIRKGELKPTKRDVVEVGQDTMMPKKFSYMK